MTVYVVARPIAGYAREDAATPGALVAVENPSLAHQISAVAAFGSAVIPLELDHIPQGLMNNAVELGRAIPDPDTNPACWHVVATLRPGFAREDPATAHAVGIYSNAGRADAVAALVGYGAEVCALVLNDVSKGLRQDAREMGVILRD